MTPSPLVHNHPWVFFFFTLDTGARRPLSLELIQKSMGGIDEKQSVFN